MHCAATAAVAAYSETSLALVFRVVVVVSATQPMMEIGAGGSRWRTQIQMVTKRLLLSAENTRAVKLLFVAIYAQELAFYRYKLLMKIEVQSTSETNFFFLDALALGRLAERSSTLDV